MRGGNNALHWLRSIRILPLSFFLSYSPLSVFVEGKKQTPSPQMGTGFCSDCVQGVSPAGRTEDAAGPGSRVMMSTGSV